MLDNIAYYRIYGFPVMMYIGIIALLFFFFTVISALRMKHGKFSMKWHHRMVVITLIAVLIHGMMALLTEGVIGTETSRKPLNSEEIVYAKRIFRENCVQCHPKGGNLINPAKPLKGSDTLIDFKTFLSFIRDTKGMMPSFSFAQISDGEAMTLYHYIIATQDFN